MTTAGLSILILCDGYPPEQDGGAERIAAYTAQVLTRRGHRVQVITFTTAAEGHAEHQGVPVKRIHRAAYPFYWRVYRNFFSPSSKRLRDLVGEYNPDLILIHNAHHYISLSDLSYLANKFQRVFITLHDSMYLQNVKVTPADVNRPETQYRHISVVSSGSRRWYLNNPLYFSRAKSILRRVKLIAVSSSLARLYEANGFHDIPVVHNGIPEGPQASDGSFTFPFDADRKPYLLHIGRLSEAKGTRVAVETHVALAKDFPDVQLILAGDRNRAEHFRSYSAFPDRVHCVGWVTPQQAAVLYSRAVCSMTLSRYLDPFPTTNLEAAQYACPVVATCFGGSPEAVEEGVTGFIVNPYEVGSVTAVLKRLLSDATLRASMKKSVRMRYEREFTLSAYGDRITRVLGIS